MSSYITKIAKEHGLTVKDATAPLAPDVEPRHVRRGKVSDRHSQEDAEADARGGVMDDELNRASDGAYYDQLAYEEAQRQSNLRLVRAAQACTAWEDGYHCWTEDRDLPTSQARSKSCVCGAGLNRTK